MAFGAQSHHELSDPGKRSARRRKLDDLRTDMHRQPDRLETGKLRREPIRRGNFGMRDAELVALAAGRNRGVRPGVDIGVDADRDPRDLPPAARQFAQRPQFGHRLNIDLVDAGVERSRELGACLADTGKDDPLGRDTGGERPSQFAFRHHVGPGAETGE